MDAQTCPEASRGADCASFLIMRQISVRAAVFVILGASDDESLNLQVARPLQQEQGVGANFIPSWVYGETVKYTGYQDAVVADQTLKAISVSAKSTEVQDTLGGKRVRRIRQDCPGTAGAWGFQFWVDPFDAIGSIEGPDNETYSVQGTETYDGVDATALAFAGPDAEGQVIYNLHRPHTRGIDDLSKSHRRTIFQRHFEPAVACGRARRFQQERRFRSAVGGQREPQHRCMVDVRRKGSRGDGGRDDRQGGDGRRRGRLRRRGNDRYTR